MAQANSAAAKPVKIKLKASPGDRAFAVAVVILLVIIDIVMLYPFLYVISTAISDPGQVMAGKVWLYPLGFSADALKRILDYPNFLHSYGNTIIYSVLGTLCTLLLTSLTAYPLSRPNFKSKGVLSWIYLFTMFFGGGMIPTYIIYKGYGLIDNRLVMILPGALSAWNIILCRTFFKTIPESLHESAHLDGASELFIMWKIILPLSKPVMATVALFTMVGIWNNYFTALLYFNDSTLYPLQLILRMILINAQMQQTGAEKDVMNMASSISTQSLKSCAIVVSILPIICIYPFIQKYFVKGVMIGSVKE